MCRAHRSDCMPRIHGNRVLWALFTKHSREQITSKNSESSLNSTMLPIFAIYERIPLFRPPPEAHHLHPPTLVSSHLSLASLLKYASFDASLNLLTNSDTSLSPATPSSSTKLSSSPRHSASCSAA